MTDTSAIAWDTPPSAPADPSPAPIASRIKWDAPPSTTQAPPTPPIASQVKWDDSPPAPPAAATPQSAITGIKWDDAPSPPTPVPQANSSASIGGPQTPTIEDKIGQEMGRYRQLSGMSSWQNFNNDLPGQRAYGTDPFNPNNFSTPNDLAGTDQKILGGLAAVRSASEPAARQKNLQSLYNSLRDANMGFQNDQSANQQGADYQKQLAQNAQQETKDRGLLGLAQDTLASPLAAAKYAVSDDTTRGAMNAQYAADQQSNRALNYAASNSSAAGNAALRGMAQVGNAVVLPSSRMGNSEIEKALPFRPDPNVNNTLGNVVGGAAPMIAAGVVNPLLGAAIAGAQGAGSALGESKDNNYTTGQTAALVAERGGVNALLGLIPGGAAEAPTIKTFAKAATEAYGINVGQAAVEAKLKNDLGIKSDNEFQAMLAAAKDPENIANSLLLGSVHNLASMGHQPDAREPYMQGNGTPQTANTPTASPSPEFSTASSESAPPTPETLQSVRSVKAGFNSPDATDAVTRAVAQPQQATLIAARDHLKAVDPENSRIPAIDQAIAQHSIAAVQNPPAPEQSNALPIDRPAADASPVAPGGQDQPRSDQQIGEGKPWDEVAPARPGDAGGEAGPGSSGRGATPPPPVGPEAVAPKPTKYTAGDSVRLPNGDPASVFDDNGKGDSLSIVNERTGKQQVVTRSDLTPITADSLGLKSGDPVDVLSRGGKPFNSKADWTFDKTNPDGRLRVLDNTTGGFADTPPHMVISKDAPESPAPSPVAQANPDTAPPASGANSTPTQTKVAPARPGDAGGEAGPAPGEGGKGVEGDAGAVKEPWQIEDAIKSNKPVPPEVLKDYPDLAAKEPTTPAYQTAQKVLASDTAADIPESPAARAPEEIPKAQAAENATMPPKGADNGGTSLDAGNPEGRDTRAEGAGPTGVSGESSPDPRRGKSVEGIRAAIQRFRGVSLHDDGTNLHLEMPDKARIPVTLTDKMGADEHIDSFLQSALASNGGKIAFKDNNGKWGNLPRTASEWNKLSPEAQKRMTDTWEPGGHYSNKDGKESIVLTHAVGEDPSLAGEEVFHAQAHRLKVADRETYNRTMMRYDNEDAAFRDFWESPKSGKQFFSRMRDGSAHLPPELIKRPLTPMEKARAKVLGGAMSEGVLMSDNDLEAFANDAGGLHPDVLDAHRLRDAQGNIKYRPDGTPMLDATGQKLSRFVDEDGHSNAVENMGHAEADRYSQRIINEVSMTKEQKIQQAAEHYMHPDADPEMREAAEKVLGRKVDMGDGEPAPFAVRRTLAEQQSDLRTPEEVKNDKTDQRIAAKFSDVKGGELFDGKAAPAPTRKSPEAEPAKNLTETKFGKSFELSGGHTDESRLLGVRRRDAAGNLIPLGKEPLEEEPKGASGDQERLLPPAEPAEKIATTGIKNAVSSADRERLGLPARNTPAGRSFDEIYQRGKDAADADPLAASKLLDELRSNPEKILGTDREAGLFLKHKVDLENQLQQLHQQAKDATAAGDPQAEREARVQLMIHRAAIKDFTDLAERTGTATGRALAARRMMSNMDYSLSHMEAMAEASKGKPLSQTELDQVHAQHEEIKAKAEALQTALDSANDRAAKAEADLELARTKNRRSQERQNQVIAQKSAPLADRIVAKLDKVGADALARIKARQAEGKMFSGVPIDPDQIRDLAIYGASKLAKGAVKFADWSVGMVKDLGEGVRPHLQTIFDASQKYIESTKSQDDLATKMKARVAGGADAQDLQPYLQKMARGFVNDGITQREPLIDALHEKMKGVIPGITREQTRDAWTGYGKFKTLDKSSDLVTLRDLHQQAQKVAQLEAVNRGEAPKATGVERQAPSDETRALTKQVNEGKKSLGIQTTDPATQLRSTLESMKTRTKNSISDLQREIDLGERTIKGKTVPISDAELDGLKQQLSDVRKSHAAIFEKPGMTDQQRLDAATKAAQKNLATMTQRLADAKNGVFAKPVQAAPITGPELEAIRAKTEAARAEVSELQRLANPPKTSSEKREVLLQKQIDNIEGKIKSGNIAPENRTPTGPDTAAVARLKAQRDALNQTLANLRQNDPVLSAKAALDAATKAASDYQQKTQAGDFLPKSKAPAPQSPDLTAALAARDSAQADYEAARKNDPAYQRYKTDAANSAYRTRVAQRIADMQDRITRNDYAKRPAPQATALDPQSLKAKADYERSKMAYDLGNRKWELKNRTIAEKVLDAFVSWRRGGVLSSPLIIGKLGAAAAYRMGIRPLEQLSGAGISKAFPGVASRAPLEGGGSIRAEAKALTEGFTSGMKDAYQVLRTGHSDLDLAYGKHAPMPPSAIEFIGNLHGALHSPTIRNEFARSFTQRTEWAISHGMDPTDPLVQTRIATDAYKDSKASAFLQDNRVVSAYSRAMSTFREPDSTGKVPLSSRIISTTADTILPIVKVPTNIAAETMQYALGTVTGGARLAHAYATGIEHLQPEQADSIMRSLKKGSLGAATLALGYFGAGSIGGFYQPGNRDKKDVSFGGVRVFGHEVPKYLVENPLLAMLQVGATIRRVADSRLHVNDSDTQGAGSGAVAAALGVIDEIPFTSAVTNTARMIDPATRTKAAGDLAKSIAVPAGVQYAAQAMDKDAQGHPIKRKPEGIAQTIESGIPVLRKNVPAAPSTADADILAKHSDLDAQRKKDTDAANRRKELGTILNDPDAAPEKRAAARAELRSLADQKPSLSGADRQKYETLNQYVKRKNQIEKQVKDGVLTRDVADKREATLLAVVQKQTS
jgi:hypothetical protein